MKFEELKAIKAMSDNSGLSFNKACDNMNVQRSYLCSTLSRGSYPRIDTYNKICAAFGYHIELVSDAGDRIILEQEKQALYKVTYNDGNNIKTYEGFPSLKHACESMQGFLDDGLKSFVRLMAKGSAAEKNFYSSKNEFDVYPTYISFDYFEDGKSDSVHTDLINYETYLNWLDN